MAHVKEGKALMQLEESIEDLVVFLPIVVLDLVLRQLNLHSFLIFDCCDSRMLMRGNSR